MPIKCRFFYEKILQQGGWNPPQMQLTFKNIEGAPQDPAFTQVFRTNHAQKLPEIHVHTKYTQSRRILD